ncbi:MAG TPA: hypothetical protein VIA19_11505 [Burkholderiales bacterium]
MNHKTVLALALASAFALSTAQVLADEDKKETSPYPQLIADEDKKDTEKPQLVSESDDAFPTGSTPELSA